MRLSNRGRVKDTQVFMVPDTVRVSSPWLDEDGDWIGGLDIRFEGQDGNEINVLLPRRLVATLRDLVTSDYNEEEEE